ncbi:MAG TPA: SurA N-terminal domain-containing protein, partial [Legionellaceae bacterium]|nr:SurA N-terminal domain-containing protein [Legionellaceae bacterium]
MRMLGCCAVMLWSLSAVAASVEALDKVAAVVNDSVITQHELDTQVELMRKQLLSKKVAIPPDTILRKQVLQHLIDVDVQLQLAKANDITIDANELDSTIAKIAEDNKLSMTQLREAISREGMTWE